MKTIEERVKEIFPNLDTITNGYDSRSIKLAISIAEEINSEWQEKVRWIPVEERLPEENKQYLVIQLNDMKTIFVGRFNTISKRWSLFGYHDHVTHWREIIE